MAKETTLYELIFGESPAELTKRMLWSKMGKGELSDKLVAELLNEGYEAIAEEEDESKQPEKKIGWLDDEKYF